MSKPNPRPILSSDFKRNPRDNVNTPYANDLTREISVDVADNDGISYFGDGFLSRYGILQQWHPSPNIEPTTMWDSCSDDIIRIWYDISLLDWKGPLEGAEDMWKGERSHKEAYELALMYRTWREDLRAKARWEERKARKKQKAAGK